MSRVPEATRRIQRGEPFHSLAVIEGEALSLEEPADVAKRDVSVVAHVRPEEDLEREGEGASREDDDRG